MNDREIVVPEAAAAFRPLLNIAKKLQGTSIMCHSMGNFVLKLVAPPHGTSDSKKPAFDHVYMVASDVADYTFDSVKNKNLDPRLNHGKNIGALARHYVHVLHSNKDLALLGRRVKNKGTAALGRTGVHPQKLHKDLRGKVVTLNCNSFNKWGWGNTICHGYHFKSEAIKYYETKHVTKK
jgi:hypothetical protein